MGVLKPKRSLGRANQGYLYRISVRREQDPERFRQFMEIHWLYPFPASQGYKKAKSVGRRQGNRARPFFGTVRRPLSQSSSAPFPKSVSSFCPSRKVWLKLKDYTITQPSCWGVTLPVCQRQRSTASWRANATRARFLCRVAALGFNNRCPQRWTALDCG